MSRPVVSAFALLAATVLLSGPSRAVDPPAGKAGDEALGSQTYEAFEPDEDCAACHVDIARQHQQSMMSQSFTHPWDEIEYFELALPHSLKEPKVAGVKAGCNGCHAPLAFLAGDIPPKRPAAKTRANEGVSCDLCHTIVGMKGDRPYNFNWIAAPGEAKQGGRKPPGDLAHPMTENPFLRSAEFCGTCHDEKSPFGTWVKATWAEWKEGPYGRANITCQQCHMPAAKGETAAGGTVYDDARQHLFHGAHDAGKLAGVAEVRIHPDELSVAPGATVKFTATVVNAKAGHKIPSGSAEERLLWIEVTAKDAKGKSWRLPVDRKEFPGEEFTIASDTAMAYQDIGEIRSIAGFAGLLRDAPVPAGSRIFRMPYFDPKGRMTICQWNTASLGTDYRLAPLSAVNETYTWKVPAGIAPGPVEVTATVHYSLLVASVAEHLKVPKSEATPLEIARHATTFTVVPPKGKAEKPM